MNARIPHILHDTLRRYLELLAREFPEVIGVYIQGSIALGAFDERTSDIDFVTVIRGEVGVPENAKIRALHRQLAMGSAWGKRFDGIYVGSAAMASQTLNRHPYIRHGLLRRNDRFGPTAREIIRRNGIILFGSDPREIIRPPSSEDLRREMDVNLNVYWVARARRPYLFLFDPWVDFAVMTLPRIIHTLETGSFISKHDAILLLEDRFPQWKDLVDDATIRRAGGGGSMFHRPVRALRTVRFAREMIDYANRTYRLPEMREGTPE